MARKVVKPKKKAAPKAPKRSAKPKPAKKKAPARKASPKPKKTAPKKPAKRPPAPKPVAPSRPAPVAVPPPAPVITPAPSPVPVFPPPSPLGPPGLPTGPPGTQSTNRNHTQRRSVSAPNVVVGRGPVSVESSRAGRKADDIPFEEADDYQPEPDKPVELTPFLRKQKQRLEELRDHLLDQMQDVAQDNLRAAPDLGGGSAFGQHMGDAGSDAYEKDFALSLLSQEQDSLNEIDAALKRVESGAYGICEKCGKRIPHERLEAIPWARFTVECQAQMERASRGQGRWESHPNFMDASESAEEDDEEESEEEVRPRAKE